MYAITHLLSVDEGNDSNDDLEDEHDDDDGQELYNKKVDT